MRRRLTDENVHALPLKPRPYFVFDASHPGLFVRVGPYGRVYPTKRDRPRRFGPRKTYETRIGDADLITIAEARKRAIDVKATVAQGIDPNRRPTQGLTFAEAWANYRPTVKSAKTLRVYDHVFAHLSLPENQIRTY